MNVYQFVCASFPFGFEGEMWYSIVLVPYHCQAVYFVWFELKQVNNQLLQLYTARTAWSDSDQAVRTVHSCNSW